MGGVLLPHGGAVMRPLWFPRGSTVDIALIVSLGVTFGVYVGTFFAIVF